MKKDPIANSSKLPVTFEAPRDPGRVAGCRGELTAGMQPRRS